MNKKRYFSKDEVKNLILHFEVERKIIESNLNNEKIISFCKSPDDGIIYIIKWERKSVIDGGEEFFGQLSEAKN